MGRRTRRDVHRHAQRYTDDAVERARRREVPLTIASVAIARRMPLFTTDFDGLAALIDVVPVDRP